MFLLTFFVVASSSLKVTQLQNLTLYLEVSGKIILFPGECGYPDPTLPMLQCNITRDGPYLQIKGVSETVPGIAFSTSTTELITTGGYQYLGPMSVETNVNRFADIHTFGVSGIIPPVDDNTLQIEFRLGDIFE